MITVEDMKSELWTLDQLRAKLAVTEPMSMVEIPFDENVGFSLGNDWNADSPQDVDRVDAEIHIHGKSYPLSKEALLSATSAIGLNQAYVERNPAFLVEPALNWSFRNGLSHKNKNDLKLLVVQELGAVITRASTNPFSNLRLLDILEEGIKEKYGEDVEILADTKFNHSYRSTTFRLIISSVQRLMTGTGRMPGEDVQGKDHSEDVWSIGLQVKNSMAGAHATEIEGYEFSYWCTNGAIYTKNRVPAENAAPNSAAHLIDTKWLRTGTKGNLLEPLYDVPVEDPETHEITQELLAETVYMWAERTCREILNELERALDAVQHLTTISVKGQASDIMENLFEEFSIPVAEQNVIRKNYENDPGPATMYRVMNSITAAANPNPDEDYYPNASHAERLLRAGGSLPEVQQVRCDQGTLHLAHSH